MKAILKHYAVNILPIPALLLAMAAAGLSGCESMAYYWQAGSGQMALMNQRQPVELVLQDESLSDRERNKVQQAVAIRNYADERLSLPAKGSYQHLVRLDSNYVTWNVFAADPLSTEPMQWCFPVAGCVSYRGYFKQHAAQAFAEKLRQQGYDVYIGGASAYSTLGWFKDPLLSTFLRYDDTRLAGLLFHELAHQQLYIKDDTTFNESFASAVEELAVAQWLTDSGRGDELEQWQRHNSWVETFARWLLMHRDGLQRIYDSGRSEGEKLAEKQAYIAAMQDAYAAFRDSHNGDRSYDAWMQQPLNNASLMSIGSYNDWVTAFKQLFAEQGCQWQAFYGATERLSESEREERTAMLEQLQHHYTGLACSVQTVVGEESHEV